MLKGERIAAWVLIFLLIAAQIFSSTLLYGEITDLRWQVEIATGARPAATPEPEDNALPTPSVNVGAVENWGASLQVRVVAATQPVSATAELSIVVRGSGAADPLLELPVLVCNGVAYPVDGDSLEQARLDLLDLITRGEAAASLLFYNGPDLTGVCGLVLNAAQSPDSIVAPRIEVPVPQQAPDQQEEGDE